jgi:hypothetical protein
MQSLKFEVQTSFDGVAFSEAHHLYYRSGSSVKGLDCTESDAGGLVENTQVLGRTIPKELCKMAL